MQTNEELVMTAFQIIEAIHAAKDGDFARAEELMKEGGEAFLEGHDAHTKLVQQEAAGDPIAMTLMLTHAEDQLMSAEGFKIIAEEMVDLCRRVDLKPREE